MVDLFKEKICNYCKKTKCQNKILSKNKEEVIIYKCEEYEKDCSKIIPYEAPAIITAKRDYTSSVER